MVSLRLEKLWSSRPIAKALPCVSTACVFAAALEDGKKFKANPCVAVAATL